MLPMMLLFTTAQASSLDLIEIGGPWGSPTANDATAAWWNPAGLAMDQGHRVHIEYAPTWAVVDVTRDEPNGGRDVYELNGGVPFAGVVSDLSVPGLGLGVALAVPIARGGAERDEPGVGRYHMRHGNTQALHGILGASYAHKDWVALGAAVHLVQSSWAGVVDTDALPDLAHGIEELGEEPGYTDAQLEDPDYAATLDFGTLRDTTLTWGAGLQVRPIDALTIGVAHIRPYDVANTGELDIGFSCPPQSDTLGRYGAELYEICYADLKADATVAYSLPPRWHWGVALQASPALRLELMGAFVGWSRFSDFDITVAGVGEKNDFHGDIAQEKAPELLNQQRLWARAAHNSWWAGVDGKLNLVDDQLVLGGRVIYDRAALPDAALSTNNWDADGVSVSALGSYRVLAPVSVHLHVGTTFYQTRTITDSGFGMTIEGEAKEDRWNYPHANGRYSATLNRVGVGTRMHF